MKNKVTLTESLFARCFNIVAGKEYLVSWQWNSKQVSKFFPLNPFLRNLFLVTVTILALGLLCLTLETGSWAYRLVSLEYLHNQNTSLKNKLSNVIHQQGSVATALDSLTLLEEKIRGLYGMNAYDKSVLSFGMGGRRYPDGLIPQGEMISEQILQSGIKNQQLQAKIGFTSSNFKQIEEFVRYRNKLWEHTPFVVPAKGQFTSGFGYRLHPVTGETAIHEGLDIANSRWTPIYATADGIVSSAANGGNFGNLVVIDHGNGYQTKYAHMSKMMVEKGQLVKRYALIGYMGDSGRATGIHLHYEVHRDGNPQNPEKNILPSGVLLD